MKYSGCITIFDDNSDVVFERDLTSDEMLESLLTKSDVPPPQDEEAEEDEPEAAAQRKSGRKCGLCGKPGHSRRNCGDDKPAAIKPKFKKGCPECGSPSRHKKGCSYTGTKRDTSIELDRAVDDDDLLMGPMDEHRFNQVRTAREHSMKSKEIADELNIDLREVNLAFQSATYDGYLERRTY